MKFHLPTLPDYLVRSDFLYVIITDSNGKLSYSNNCFNKQFGKLSSNLFSHFSHVPDISLFKKKVKKIPNRHSGKFSLAIDLHSKTKKVSRTKWEFRLYNNTDTSKTILGIGFDYSEWHYDEKDKIYLLHHAPTIIESLNEGFVIQDKKGKIIGSNQRAVEILGLGKKEMHGRTSKDKRWRAIRESGSPFPGEEHPPMQALTTKKPVRNFVMGIHQKKGSLKWLLVNSQPLLLDGSPEPQAVVSLFNDITDEKEAELRIRETNQFMQYLFGTISNTIWEFDFKNGFAFRNESFKKIFGYTHGKMFYSRSWWLSKLHQNDRKKVEAEIKKSLREKRTYWECEYRFRAKNGEYKNVLDRAFIVYCDHKPIRMVGAMQDLTDKRYLEEQLLKKEVETKQQIIEATITAQETERHELGKELHDNVNQILAVSKLYLDIAHEQGDLGGNLLKAKNYLNEAMEEIRKISHHLTLHSREFSLLSSMSSLIQDLEAYRKFRVYFRCNHFNEGKIPKNIAVSVYRIFQEKIKNIIKYSQAKNVKITLRVTGEKVLFRISDDGIGFDLNEKRKGIGLSNIYSRIENLNGTIKLRTEKGKGVNMQITIPLAQTLKKVTESNLVNFSMKEKRA